MDYRKVMENDPKVQKDANRELMLLYNKGYMAEHPMMFSGQRIEPRLKADDEDVWGY